MFASAGKILLPEITEEILSRLPPKSLGRFKSVSKTWRSLISDPQFIKTHINNKQCHQTTTKLILVPRYDDSLYSIDLNKPLPYLNVEVPATAKQLTLGSGSVYWKQMLGSCNGLVLAKDLEGSMYLMNPTTTTQEQDLFKVSPSPFVHPDSSFSACCGFGYDSLTDDYKVLWISYTNNYLVSRDIYLSVYSLRKNSWKKLPNLPYEFNELCGALVNRNYHWSAGFTTVLVFSLADEAYNEIKLPDLLQNQHIRFTHMVELGGKLGVFVGAIGDSSHLWVMDEYGNSKSWARIFSHKFTFPADLVSSVEGSNRDIVLDNLNGDEVVVFNIDEKRWRKVRIVGGPYEFHVGGTFVESIESPKRFILAP